MELAKLDASNNNGRYKLEAICNSVVYTKKSKSGHLSRLYYLVFLKKIPRNLI